MRKSVLIHLLVGVSGLTCLGLGLSLPAAAQDETPTKITSQNRAGDLPFSSSIGTDIEHVDAVSGSLSVRIPLTSVPGRGMNFNFALRSDGGFWTVATRTVSGSTWQLWNIERRNYLPGATTGLGWEVAQPSQTHSKITTSCPGGDPATVFLFRNWIYTDAGGAKHPLLAAAGSDCLNNGATDTQAPDLSSAGIWVNTSGGMPKFYQADGSMEQLLLGSLDINGGYLGAYYDSQDPNGNKKAEKAGGLDTLGRVIVTQTNGTNQILYKVKDSNGVLQTYTVNYANVSLSTNFNITGVWGLIREYTGTRSAITSIVLPNGRQYSFQYENNSYGGITRIDFPTGAYVTYTWASLICADQTRRYVTSRTLTVNGQSYIWTIQPQLVGGTCVGAGNTTTVTDPLGNQTVYTGSSGSITEAKIYQGTAVGMPLRDYVIEYAVYDDPYGVGDAGMLPSRITTTLENGLVSKKEFDYDSFTYTYTDTNDPNQFTPGQIATLSRGNVTEIREYDWGQGVPGALLRKTDKTYLHNSNSNYLTRNIVNKVLSDTVYDGAGAQKAQTQFEYDSTAITATSGAPQHDYTNYPSTFLYRGNATKVKKWRNTDGALLTSTYIYDDLGNIRSLNRPRQSHHHLVLHGQLLREQLPAALEQSGLRLAGHQSPEPADSGRALSLHRAGAGAQGRERHSGQPRRGHLHLRSAGPGHAEEPARWRPDQQQLQRRPFGLGDFDRQDHRRPEPGLDCRDGRPGTRQAIATHLRPRRHGVWGHEL